MHNCEKIGELLDGLLSSFSLGSWDFRTAKSVKMNWKSSNRYAYD